MFKFVFDEVLVSISVGDPDPPVIGPPGSGSISRTGAPIRIRTKMSWIPNTDIY
jgi:hypothetical protein